MHDFGNLLKKADHYVKLNAEEKEIYFDPVHLSVSETPSKSITISVLVILAMM